MVIKVLGKGCKRCKMLESHVKKAVTDLALDASIEKVTDINQIADYGVIQTPALVIDDVVKAKGFIPSVSQIKTMLQEK